MAFATPRLLAAFAACSALLAAPGAVRAAAVTVVLLRLSPPGHESWPEAEQRARAELRAIGLSVEEAAANAQEPAAALEELERLARERNAMAALRLRRSADGRGIDVWLFDEISGKTSLRRVATSHLPPSEGVAQVALRVVELLNASLLELSTPYARRNRSPPPPEVMEMVDRTLAATAGPYRWALRLGVGVAGAPGGLGVVGGPSLAVGRGISGPLALEADFHGSVLQSSFERAAGNAAFGLALARLHLVWRLWSERRVSGRIGLGGGALVGWARPIGSARGDYVGRDDATAVSLASAAAGLAWRLSRSVRAYMGVAAGAAFPRLSLSAGGETVGTAGRPLLDASLGLEWNTFGERAP